MALLGMPSNSVGFGGLHHHHAALALDRAHPEGAIRTGAREHDAHGALVLVCGERAEKEIDRQALAAGRGGLEQLQRAVEEGHVAIGRDDVGAVGLDDHAVLDFEHLHAGVAPDQVGEDALVIGREVLHQHESHARVDFGRHAGEEGLERGETAGGGADADDGERRMRQGRGNRTLGRRGRRRGVLRLRNRFGGGACRRGFGFAGLTGFVVESKNCLLIHKNLLLANRQREHVEGDSET